MDFNRLSTELPNGNLKKIYGLISDSYPSGVADSKRAPSLSIGKIEEIQQLMRDEVETGYVTDGTPFQTLSEAKEKSKMVVNDAFFNPSTGIGTGLDPSYYNQASIPISLSPNEATALYANGGLGQSIIDKKSKGILINGYQFAGKDWEQEELEELQDYANMLGFDKTVVEGWKNGLIYGGALVIPAFKKDNPASYAMGMKKLISSRVIEKDSLERFWVADRWNAVLIPSYNISAQDYLSPKSYYVPIAGLEVNSDRLAILRPIMLPYWGTIRQMGWGMSDFQGYLQSILNYEVAVASIPVMTQQLSLMYHHIPMDGLIAQNGAQYANQYAKLNTQEMNEWSNVKPRTINSFGEIKVINRQFTNFEQLIQLVRQDIGAKCGIAESILFDTQSSGIGGDNSNGKILNQSEAIQMSAREASYQLKPILKTLAYSCFGPDSPQAKKADRLSIKFESPVVLSSQDKIASLTAFSGAYASFYNSGLSVDSSLKLSKVFIDMDIPKEVLEEIEQPEMEEMGARDADFKEEDHPRANNGPFGSGGSGEKKITKEEFESQKESVASKYKGTDKWLKSPNGKETKLSEDLWVQTRTDNFKSWFGDFENDPENSSKLVDENGDPKVLYHGGSTDIEEIGKPKRGSLGSIYLTDDKEVAQKYALLGGIDPDLESVEEYASESIRTGVNKKRTAKLANLFSVIKNPITPSEITTKSIIDSMGRDYVKKIVSSDSKIMEMEDSGDYDGYESSDEWLDNNLENYINEEYSSDEVIGSIENDLISIGEDNITPAFALLHISGNIESYMEDSGHDGFIYKDLESGGNSIIPLKGNQVKSANKNNGSFNKKTNNIKDSFWDRLFRKNTK